MTAMRLVSNLVANAIKYTDCGKILVGCRRSAAGIRLVVADTGPGMEPEELARVMHLRERGSAAKKTDGHGLGLGIATALAATGGYKLTCRSTPGKGTAFFIDFELTPAP
jgi:signal transduction histidine kinase